MSEATNIETVVDITNAPEVTFAAIQQMVADCLAVDADEVVSSAKFFEDLGGESIDLLDLSFQFERKFHIRVPFKSFTNTTLLERDEMGSFTSAARELMARDFPYLDLEQRVLAAGSVNPRSLLTIDLMFQMLVHAEPSLVVAIDPE